MTVTTAPSSRPSTTNASATKPTSTDTVARAEINEDSPTIKRILAASGCASVAELLERDQQKANATSGSKRACTTLKATGLLSCL